MKQLLGPVLGPVLAVAMLTAGCADDRPDGATARTTACPDDVEVQVLPAHSCGYVDRRDGSTVFFVRVRPPAKPSRNSIIETGVDLGVTPDYGGLVPIAQRTGREVIIVDLPGVGHSTPLLACPQVDQLAGRMADDEEASGPLLVDAVGVCRAKFTRTIDFASVAAAFHDVVTALHLDQVVAMSHGTTGRAALAWAAAYPSDLEALVLDTPLLTTDDPVDRVNDLVHEVAEACAAQRRCRHDHPALEGHWRAAVADLHEHPLTVPTGDSVVRIDDTRLRRAVLWVAGGSPRPQGLPGLIEAAAGRTTDEQLDRYARALVHGPPLCVGYLPKCASAPRTAVGAVLSLNCPTLLSQPGWQELCRAWGATTVAPMRRVSTPTLVFTGRYDPFSPSATVRAALADVVPGAHYVEDPAGGHNVLGSSDCVRQIRNDWLAGDVHDPPVIPACLAERTIPFPTS